MNQLIKAYFFIPSGFRKFIENGFEGWGILFFLYFLFALIFTRETAPDFKIGVFIFLQPLAILFLMAVLSTIAALIVGAKEPLIKGIRLTALCLPPISLTFYFMAIESPLVFFAVYPILLFIYGSAFLGPRLKILNITAGIITIGLALSLSYLFGITADNWFGQRLTFDGYKVELSRATTFDRNEYRIYRFLVLSPPDLGHIPQAEEIADSLKIKLTAVREALVKLDGKGCIVYSADGEIRYAYPWSAYNQGFKVIVEKTPDADSGQAVYAASALHSLAVAALFPNARIKILTHIRDTGDGLIIEINDQQIDLVNRPQVQVYKSNVISEIEFYSSPSGAKSSYRGRFDSTRLLSLDRAIAVANELMRNNSAGVFE
jgi:hypothetical protein